MDKWKLTWQITKYGDEELFDSFEEAKAAFRNKISREIDFSDSEDSFADELEEEENGEEIMNFLEKFMKNEDEESDYVEGDYEGDFTLSINQFGINIEEDESYGEQVYPTITSNFIQMDDPNKEYRFEYIDYYDPNKSEPDPEFSGFGYHLYLKK